MNKKSYNPFHDESNNPFDDIVTDNSRKSTNPFDEVELPVSTKHHSNIKSFIINNINNKYNYNIIHNISSKSDKNNNPFDDESIKNDKALNNNNININNNDSKNEVNNDLKLNDQEKAIVRFLSKGRVYGYPHSYGLCICNYLGFVLNNHPFLSILCSHKLHPFSKRKRLTVFISSLFFSFGIIYILTVAFYTKQLNVCKAGCKKETILSADGNTFTQCTGGKNNGVQYSQYRQQCQIYHDWFVPAIGGICIVMYSSYLRLISTCSCVNSRQFFQQNCIGTKFKKFIEFFGGGVLFLFLFLSFILLIITILLCWKSSVGFGIFIDVILSKIWSFGWWFLVSLPYFVYYYPKHKLLYLNKIEKLKNNSINDIETQVIL